MNIPAYTLIHYVRDNNGDPRGVIVAIKTEDGVSIGWSYCRKTDRFTKEMALKIAIGRAEVDVGYELPHKIAKEMKQFISRCKKYYKLECVG